MRARMRTRAPDQVDYNTHISSPDDSQVVPVDCPSSGKQIKWSASHQLTSGYPTTQIVEIQVSFSCLHSVPQYCLLRPTEH